MVRNASCNVDSIELRQSIIEWVVETIEGSEYVVKGSGMDFTSGIKTLRTIVEETPLCAKGKTEIWKKVLPVINIEFKIKEFSDREHMISLYEYLKNRVHSVHHVMPHSRTIINQ